ncbi:hypothetical protein BDU57DRAFT_456657 [Ampelomyces quisqualis]|uniref:Invertebrate defensins family profile domain-containing protein n=1 Tax=Ampelomyces quisqualis TaxID=50730 RepID=A0A6A5QFA4_AMPQU|nr:hypothetical protein BDU57DRAFT_456657 [Ampelomyces quisqualis]
MKLSAIIALVSAAVVLASPAAVSQEVRAEGDTISPLSCVECPCEGFEGFCRCASIPNGCCCS